MEILDSTQVLCLPGVPGVFVWCPPENTSPEFDLKGQQREWFRDQLYRLVISLGETKRQLKEDNPSWQRGDPRLDALGLLYYGCATALSGFSLAHNDDENFWRSLYPLINKYSLEVDDLLFRDNLDTFTWGGLLSLVTAALEDIIRKCLRVVAPGKACDGRATFGSVYPALVKTLTCKPSFPDPPANYKEALDLFYWVRNSVHNNGWFLPETPGDHFGAYEGIPYDFQDGKPVVMQYRLVIAVLEKIGELIYWVVMHPEIRYRDASEFYPLG